MLNLVVSNIEDQKILDNSFKSIKNKEQLIIVDQESEKKVILNFILDILTIPKGSECRFQNLFKVSLETKVFYIAQCILDFGYPIGSHSSQTFEHKYEYCTIGVAHLKTDFGHTYLRPETKFDRFCDRFLRDDIDFANSDKFSEKYYLKSNRRDIVTASFEKNFLDTIAKSNDLIISIRGKVMCIAFNNDFNSGQSGVVERLFESFKFVSV